MLHHGIFCQGELLCVEKTRQGSGEVARSATGTRGVSVMEIIVPLPVRPGKIVACHHTFEAHGQTRPPYPRRGIMTYARKEWQQPNSWRYEEEG